MIEGRYGMQLELDDVYEGCLVRVKDELPRKFYQEGMSDFCGEYAAVTFVEEDSEGFYVKLDIDNEKYTWSEWHLEIPDEKPVDADIGPELDEIFA